MYSNVESLSVLLPSRLTGSIFFLCWISWCNLLMLTLGNYFPYVDIPYYSYVDYQGILLCWHTGCTLMLTLLVYLVYTIDSLNVLMLRRITKSFYVDSLGVLLCWLSGCTLILTIWVYSCYVDSLPDYLAVTFWCWLSENTFLMFILNFTLTLIIRVYSYVDSLDV